MAKKFIEICTRYTRRNVCLEDIKKIYFRVPKKRPVLPLYQKTIEIKEETI